MAVPALPERVPSCAASSSAGRRQRRTASVPLMKCQRRNGPRRVGLKPFRKRRIFRDSLGFDRHPWSCTFDSALAVTFGDQISMIGGAATNGDTPLAGRPRCGRAAFTGDDP